MSPVLLECVPLVASSVVESSSFTGSNNSFGREIFESLCGKLKFFRSYINCVYWKPFYEALQILFVVQQSKTNCLP
jgi:hypothetical protein